MTTDRQPDISEDPGEQGTGQGYPESNPQGQTPAEGTKSGQGPEGNTGGEAGDADAPASQSDEAPSGATGNRGAAGG